MSKKSLILSSAGLKNLVPNINNIEDEFLFVFGEQEIRMSKINAEFVSPLISRIHSIDSTIQIYQYPADERMKDIFDSEILRKMKKLCLGEPIEIDKTEINKFESISILLWNEELQTKLKELFPINFKEKEMINIIKELSIEEYIIKHGNQSMIDRRSIIEYIANNFYELKDQEIDELIKFSPNLLLSILSCPSLKVSSEDELFEFIKKIIDHKRNEKLSKELIYDFYEIIKLENLSLDHFKEFIELIDENNMTRTLWQKLKQILISNYHENSNETNSQSCIELPNCVEKLYNGKEEGAFKGIIAFLTEKCGGNVSDKNEVNVTASSQSVSDRSAKCAVNLEDKQHYFQSDENDQNSWLKYDFKERKVRPTHYSIRTRHDYGKGYQHPQHWVIEGSNTDRDDDWKILDSRRDITILDGINLVHTFEIQEKIDQKDFFRYLRIRQTGKNIRGTYNLTISALEYFGKMI